MMRKMRKKDPKIHHTSSRLVFLSLDFITFICKFSHFLPCCFYQELSQENLKVAVIGCNDLYVLAYCAHNVQHLSMLAKIRLLYLKLLIYGVCLRWTLIN